MSAQEKRSKRGAPGTCVQRSHAHALAVVVTPPCVAGAQWLPERSL
jgi:hypothetical protein